MQTPFFFFPLHSFIRKREEWEEMAVPNSPGWAGIVGTVCSVTGRVGWPSPHLDGSFVYGCAWPMEESSRSTVLFSIAEVGSREHRKHSFRSLSLISQHNFCTWNFARRQPQTARASLKFEWLVSLALLTPQNDFQLVP